MNIGVFEQYKVIEFERGIAIVPPTGEVRGANNLIIADLSTCLEYLNRYIPRRLYGDDVKAAHDFALKGAHVIKSVVPQ